MDFLAGWASANTAKLFKWNRRFGTKFMRKAKKPIALLRSSPVDGNWEI